MAKSIPWSVVERIAERGLAQRATSTGWKVHIVSTHTGMSLCRRRSVWREVKREVDCDYCLAALQEIINE